MRTYLIILITFIAAAMLCADLSGCKKYLISPNHYSDSTIVAGADSAGFTNGPAANALFNHPFGLTLDKSGNIYVADQGNSLIRMITPGGEVSTFAGMVGMIGSANGIDTSASFNKPFSVAADSLGNVYVADAGNNVIRKIGVDGTVSTFAGTGVPGSADGTDTATFN